MHEMIESKKESPARQPILIVFMGRRGGGQVILEHLVSQCDRISKDFGCVVWKSSDNSSYLGNKVKRIDFLIPHKMSKIANPVYIYRFFMCIFKIRSELSKLRPNCIVQIIPSPFDFFIDYFGHKMQIPIIRLVHDVEPHIGESWPNRRALSVRIRKATSLIVFSNFVERELCILYKNELKNKRIEVAQLPGNIDRVAHSSAGTSDFFTDYSSNFRIAYLGRAIEYKGLEILANALGKMDVPFDFIAGGEGKYPKSLTTEYKVFNRWLSDWEFISIMNECNVLVLPYIEASQSGIIPIARQLQKWILATDVGGLKEQLDGYPRAVIVVPGNADSLARGLRDIHLAWSKNKGSAHLEDSGLNIPSLTEAIRRLLQVENTGDLSVLSLDRDKFPPDA